MRKLFRDLFAREGAPVEIGWALDAAIALISGPRWPRSTARPRGIMDAVLR